MQPIMNEQCKRDRINANSVFLLATFTFFVFAPLEIILSNPSSFWFSIKSMLPIILISFVLCFGILYGVDLVLIRFAPKLSIWWISLVFGLGFAFYIQGNYMFVSYGFLDGTPIDWSQFGSWPIWNGVLWIILLAVPIIACAFFSKKVLKYFKHASLFIVGIQVITIITLLITYQGKDKDLFYSLSNKGIFEFSSNKENVIVLIADGFDGEDFLPILEERPDYRSAFNGFTFFADNCGTSFYSQESGITLLTGNQLEVTDSFSTGINQAYQKSPVFSVLQQQNYDISLYIGNSDMVSPLVLDQVQNNSVDEGFTPSLSNGFQAGKMLYQLVSFRYMPHSLKEPFWMTTMDFNKLKSNDTFTWDNVKFYQSLMQEGISASSTKNNQYKFYWIQGPHEPVVMDQDCNPLKQIVKMDNPKYQEMQFEQSIGTIKIFTELLAQLKKENIYDNTTIILAGDHGWDNRPNPLLLIKPKGSIGELEISHSPTSMIEDYSATFEYLLTGQKGTQPSMFELDPNMPRMRPLYKYDIEHTTRKYFDRETLYFPSGHFIKAPVSVSQENPLVSLDFSETGNGGNIVSDGWGLPQESGRWALSQSRMNFDLMDNRDVTLVVQGNIYKHTPEVEVLYNGTKVATWQSKTGDYTALLPKVLKSPKDTQEVLFLAPSAASPASIDNSNTDRRKLSIFVKEMQLILRDAYSLGTPLSFTKDLSTASTYCVSGFSDNEEDFTWTDKATAQMEFPFNQIPDNMLTCVIRLNHVYNTSQRVNISAAGNTLFEGVADKDHLEITFTVPKECLQGDTLTLDFALPDAISPAELGKSTDNRKLALAMREIQIR